jgi:methyl coenzyme M reductase gamma subunit
MSVAAAAAAAAAAPRAPFKVKPNKEELEAEIAAIRSSIAEMDKESKVIKAEIDRISGSKAGSKVNKTAFISETKPAHTPLITV